MRSFLFILVSFIAVTTTLSGLLMISNPDGGVLNLPRSLLAETPFTDLLIPGILLTTIVGFVNLLVAFYNPQRHPDRYNRAITGGMMISGWIIIQMILIQTIHWLHLIYLGVGMLIILIAYQLKAKWAV